MRLILFIQLFFYMTLAHGQVGLAELNSRVRDDYAGDISVIVRTVATLPEVFEAHGFKQFIGWRSEDKSGDPLDRCSFKVKSTLQNYVLEITDYFPATPLNPVVHAIEIPRRYRLEESLFRGLESLTANYRLEKVDDKTSRKVLFSITHGEGFTIVTLDSGGSEIKCVTILDPQ